MPADAERAYPTHWEADVVLRDGGTARVRPIAPDDADRLVAFYERVSDESKYYRFFAPYPRLSDRDVRRFTHHDYDDRVGLAATVGGEFIATVRYDRVDADGRPAASPADLAEVAFLVRDDQQGRGVGSALLEHIAAVARERGIRRFMAEVLPANGRMIKVFTDVGYSARRRFEDGSVRLTLDIEPTEQSLAVMHAREQRAEGRSVGRLLAPASVAVVGVSRTPGGAGRSVLESLREGGFTGRTYAVNAALTGPAELAGVPAHPRIGDLPETVDLAVVAVPAARVPEVAADCGERGVQGLVVLSADFTREAQRDLVRQARAYGMRVVGPNALGVINTDPDVRLNATPSTTSPARGRVGLFTQSGAIGIALLDGLHRRGAGLSTFVSAGNRADVSGNDVLQFWDDDPDTDVVLMYLESIGNPRKFTRIARRVAVRKPLVVVKGARHSGSAPPPGHAAPATRTPDATVSSLLRQAGVITVDTVTEQLDTGLLLASQPLPAGPRVAILGNTESLGLLTYDAALTDGLRPLPATDLTTAATPDDFRRAVRAAVADPGTDAVVVTVIPWVDDNPATALADAVREAASAVAPDEEAAPDDGTAPRDADGTGLPPGPAKPVAVVHLAIDGLAEALAERGIPAYPAAERAVRALAHAVRLGAWRRSAESPGRVPEFDVAESAAAELLARATREAHAAEAAEPGEPGTPSGTATPARTGRGARPRTRPRADTGTRTAAGPAPSPEARGSIPLAPADVAALLGHYGIAVQPTLPAPTREAAVAAARRLGYPVAFKTTAPHLRHRADLGGVRLDVPGRSELRRVFAEVTDALGPADELRPVVQAMAPRGVDTVVRAAVDPSIGAVLSFGLAGPPSELLGDMAHRLVPATDRDVAELVRTIRSAPILFGWRGARPVDTGALEELLLRVSRLLDDHPEIVAVDLEPAVVAPRGVTVLSASVRVAEPPVRDDSGPRRLPAY
ncbi:bifunctional GNAT family N-acetyltransferase/acetate--CoA ligase family protein [Streptomyces sp. Z26]|uniref:bifunctional acetate--CoA ligase family protein/GNAT family N-acetyltransferase n=1 Tax=Streptomyces sp. Z26 TaxID=2500177 RepID=UPI000EF154B9|nr:bifunctional GNAT family N-acetyltransferase/acetate--CoA ligase family protein [Streptomyces sp. Z26]RLL69241.1 GNAT family N-acetyltransferase [Streptomyces sp. Z26]